MMQRRGSRWSTELRQKAEKSRTGDLNERREFWRPGRLLWIVAFAFLTLSVLPESGFGIPAFARKYRLSCTTCHAPVPRLKAYGEDFAGNAFQLEGKEPARFFRDTGDPILTLQRELPIAIRLDSYIRLQTEEGTRKSDLQTPYGLKFLSGGQIARDISYYFYFYLSEHGEIAGIEDAYVHFNNLFGTDLDLMIGQFQVSDPLFKRELRLTYEDYLIYKVRVGNVRANLTYDRGAMLTYSAKTGTDVVLELVNGNGKGEATGDQDFDSDNFKNVVARVSQSLGPARVGGFGYFGKERRRKLVPAGQGGRWVDTVDHLRYLGVDATVDFGKDLQVNFQFLQRHDDNPYLMHERPVSVDTRGFIAELIWALQGEMGRSFVTFLYNRVRAEVSPGPGYRLLDYETATASYSYLLRRNFRLVFESTYDRRRKSARFLAGFVSAF